MKLLSCFLVILFVLIGAHVPKAFSLLYLALAITWVMARLCNPIPLLPLPPARLRLLRLVQVLVLAFSLSYPLAMLHYGFWQLAGRQLFDFMSALLLPSALLAWGVYLARARVYLLGGCFLAYALGALVFLVAALFKTWGLAWFVPHDMSTSLLMAWGSEPSMNVRSVEQNGFLAITLLPVGVMLWRLKHYLAASFVCLAAVLGAMAVMPLGGGRLWIASLLLALLPLGLSVGLAFSRALRRFGCGWRLQTFLPLMIISALCVWLWPFTRNLCDERWQLFVQAFQRWPQLFAGGRQLAFGFMGCEGPMSLDLSPANSQHVTITMMHNVALDVVASIGLLPALPLLALLVIALVEYVRLLQHILAVDPSLPGIGLKLTCLWCCCAVLLPQWMFQPLIYGDGLLYYFSYAAVGVLLVFGFNGKDPVPSLQCEEPQTRCQAD